MSNLIVLVLALAVTVVSGTSIQSGIVNMYRYWNHVEHFYTTNSAEIGTITVGCVGKYGYKYEGIAFYAYSFQCYGTVPLYRYYNGKNHFYTINSAEIGTTVYGNVGLYGYNCEGVAAYVFSSNCNCKSDLKPLYRYFNGVDHFYTTNSNDIGTTTVGCVGKYGYKYEGIACWVY